MPTVIILGAGSDIGSAIANHFARKGYNIQLAARDAEKLKPLQSDIQIRYQVNCSVHSFNADEFQSHADFWHSLSEKPDVAIYVIGYMTENEMASNDLNQSLRTINANYTGAVSFLNIVSGNFASRGSGTIVGISSVAGDRGRQSNYIYGSAKAAFSAYLSGLRNKMFHKNVHVLTVKPGFVYTKMTEHLELPKMLTAHPNEVAQAVYKGVVKKKNVVYVKWFWRWIMLVIKLIPEGIFKKLKM
jgi:short-subunit dehydrogenase